MMRDISSTFADNTKLPIHRWFRFTAGFSAAWAKSVISERSESMVLDPFAGSGTSLLAAEEVGVKSCGIEAHPFFSRVAKAKLAWRSDPDLYLEFATTVRDKAKRQAGDLTQYPELIRRCYDDDALGELDGLRLALAAAADDSPASELTWLTLVSILRRVTCVKSAQWQYILPNQAKKPQATPYDAFERMARIISEDMRSVRARCSAPVPRLVEADARDGGFPGGVSLVITSPPYPNNFDYADATRLEMSFMREIDGWSGLKAFSGRLVRSCSQHSSSKVVDLAAILSSPEIEPIKAEIESVCSAMDEVRQTRGGKKNYHLMIAAYFLDLARVWDGLRAACEPGCRVCFVVGDSAPYGVHVPVDDWLGRLAVASGFKGFRFERTRDRNTKWKNRKHRVPLCEGRLWVEG